MEDLHISVTGICCASRFGFRGLTLVLQRFGLFFITTYYTVFKLQLKDVKV